MFTDFTESVLLLHLVVLMTFVLRRSRWLFLQITTFNMSLVVHGTCAEVNDMKNVSSRIRRRVLHPLNYNAIKEPVIITLGSRKSRLLCVCWPSCLSESTNSPHIFIYGISGLVKSTSSENAKEKRSCDEISYYRERLILTQLRRSWEYSLWSRVLEISRPPPLWGAYFLTTKLSRSTHRLACILISCFSSISLDHRT